MTTWIVGNHSRVNEGMDSINNHRDGVHETDVNSTTVQGFVDLLREYDGFQKFDNRLKTNKMIISCCSLSQTTFKRRNDTALQHTIARF